MTSCITCPQVIPSTNTEFFVQLEQCILSESFRIHHNCLMLSSSQLQISLICHVNFVCVCEIHAAISSIAVFQSSQATYNFHSINVVPVLLSTTFSSMTNLSDLYSSFTCQTPLNSASFMSVFLISTFSVPALTLQNITGKSLLPLWLPLLQYSKVQKGHWHALVMQGL